MQFGRFIPRGEIVKYYKLTMKIKSAGAKRSVSTEEHREKISTITATEYGI